MIGTAAERSGAGTLLYTRGPLLAPRPARTTPLRVLDAVEPSGGTRLLQSLDAVEPPGGTRPLHTFARGEPLPGTPYVVVRLLGQGGMGEVYEVEHRELGRRFAVKVLHRSHAGRPDLSARLRDEARSIARLRHRSLPEVFDLGATEGGRPYFAMELLDGRDLRAELTRAGALAIPAALDLVQQALSALSLAHAAGIVHRDLKLENLFLCNDGTLKVLDFGVAKLLHAGASLTAPDVVIGTPRTMAPEQCAALPVDPRVDIYAMGLVLYELVAGRGPFDELRGRCDALRSAHCELEPPPPSRFAPQPVPAALERLILRAIAKAPEHRYQTAADMEAAVRRLREAAPLARRPQVRSKQRVCPLHHGGPAASRAVLLGVCAIALASAALGLTLAQRWRAGGDLPAPAPPAAQLRPAVR